MTPDPNRMSPFSNGSEFISWKAENCDDCVKRYDDESRKWRCDLEYAIDAACVGDGTITTEIADRIGRNDLWMASPCRERLT